MANRYYDPGDHRAARVNDLFAAVAPRYDLINDLQSLGLHRGWKRRLTRMATGSEGQSAHGRRAGGWALDLCCGTGDVSFALANAGFATIGLDFSGPMLSVAARRLVKQSRAKRSHSSLEPGQVQFVRGDAQQLPFADRSFDVVTISYGLRNLTRWQSGLAEMLRVTKPGGRLLALDFGKPDNRLWRAFYFGYLRSLVPLFGRLFCGDSHTHSYIIESLHHYPAQHGVAAEMRRLGCFDVGIVNLLGGVMTINHGIRPADTSLGTR